MPQRPTYPFQYLHASPRARCVITFEPFTDCGGCCGTSNGFPSSCYANVPDNYSGIPLSSVGITHEVWMRWVHDYRTSVAPNSNQCCMHCVTLSLWMVGLGWICCCCGTGCSSYHRSARAWLERVNATLEPNGAYAKFQTIGVYVSTGKGGTIYNYTYFVIALTPDEANKLRSEPVRMMNNCCQCCAG